jgi:hypothetical protein
MCLRTTGIYVTEKLLQYKAANFKIVSYLEEPLTEMYHKVHIGTEVWTAREYYQNQNAFNNRKTTMGYSI